MDIAIRGKRHRGLRIPPKAVLFSREKFCVLFWFCVVVVVVGAAERIIRGMANMILTMILIRHYSFFFHALVFLVVRVIRAKEEESSLCFGALSLKAGESNQCEERNRYACFFYPKIWTKNGRGSQKPREDKKRRMHET